MSFDEERDNLIFELARNALDREWQRISDLDGKAANLVGFTGVIIGFALGNASLLQAKLSTNFPLLSLFALAVVTLLVSFMLGIWGFMVRKWSIVPDPIAVINGYADGSYEQLLLAVGGEMAKVEREVRVKNDAKAKQIRRSTYLMLLGLVLAFIFVFFSLIVE